ncbi:hypothetical protein NLU03_28285 [Bacillus toyonensis]|nr:hypothetical protein [Bacillus toyonensis]
MFEERKLYGRPVYQLKYLGETVAMCSRKWGRWEVRGVVFNTYISAKTKYESIKVFEEQYRVYLRGTE